MNQQQLEPGGMTGTLNRNDVKVGTMLVSHKETPKTAAAAFTE